MSNLLTGSVERAGLAQATVWPNLFVVPSGPIPPSPAELLAGPRLKALLTEATREFDIVVADAPPVVGLADAPLIASVATGCLLVVEVGQTTRANVQAAVRRLQMANGHILGALLTKFDVRKSTYGYGYTYSYEYDYKYGAKSSKATADPQLGRHGVDIAPPAA
jgi:capsular exopolysaccharide synthesis family protein